MHGGVKHPVFYASKKLIPREQNYSVGEREALAIIWAVKKFHRYLYGQHFTLESDYRPLEYLQTIHSQNPRIMRWSLALQPYRYTHGRPQDFLLRWGQTVAWTKARRRQNFFKVVCCCTQVLVHFLVN